MTIRLVPMNTDQTTLPMPQASLAEVVSPTGVGEFLERYWKREVYFCSGSPRLAEQLLLELGPPAIPGPWS